MKLKEQPHHNSEATSGSPRRIPNVEQQKWNPTDSYNLAFLQNADNAIMSSFPSPCTMRLRSRRMLTKVPSSTTILHLPQPNITFHDRKHEELLKRVDELYRTCSKSNWDNEGSRALYRSVRRPAEKLIESLPSTFPYPDINADDDGDLLFEWYKTQKDFFIVTVTTQNRMTYLSFRGDDISKGNIAFEDKFPVVFETHLQSLYG